MAIPVGVSTRFETAVPSLERLESYVKSTIDTICESDGYEYTGRKKLRGSVAEKLDTGRVPSWSALDDLLAYTIVVPTRSHEPGVIAKLDAAFDRTRVASRDQVQTAPDVFRFDATRWYGAVRKQPPPPGLLDEDLPLIFEVQIHTAFEHAWTAVTHSLVYKGDRANWQEQRLASQLKASVEQIDLLIDTFEGSAKEIPQGHHGLTDAQTKAREIFASLEEDGFLDAVVPESWQRLIESASQLVRNPGRSAYKTAEALTKLCEGFDASVRDGTFVIAKSGSLMQALVAYELHRGRKQDDLAGFYVVWDESIAGIYGGDGPPSRVDLDS